MRGNQEASGVKYVPPELFELWEKKDPIKNYEAFLLNERILTEQAVTDIRNEIKEYIEAELILGNQSEPINPNTVEEINDIYAPVKIRYKELEIRNKKVGRFAEPQTPTLITESNDYNNIVNRTSQIVHEKRFVDALSDGLRQSMKQHPNLILMGQDIAEYGGAFKITEGFVQQFGKERVRNTPICESAIVGAALGLSLEGYKSVMEMQFADFVTVGFNQIINNLAKSNYRWGQNADVVIRMPTGGGVGAGPFHSQSNEAWFVHTPGLKVVYPSTPEDAKGLLIAAINDPNPVLFFEHKALYRSISGNVPDEYYEIEIGKARTIDEGDDITIITYGAGVHWTTDYSAKHPHTSIEILDLRTLLPLDYDAIKNAVLKTGKVLILHEDTLIGGIGGEIAAWISENCFDKLDAPVMRCASLDTPIPFNAQLEKNFRAYSRLEESVEKVLNYVDAIK